MSSETPLSARFWREPVDIRPLALLRAALGLLVALDLVDRLSELNAFYTDGGLMPLARVKYPTIFSVAHGESGVIALFVLGLGLALLVVAGLATRVTTPLLWVLVTSLHHRNTLVLHGSDDVLRLLLFWGCFVDWGAAYSLDVRWGRRPPTRTVAALPVRLMQLQIAYVYLATFVLKLGGHWSDGSALAFALQTPGFVRPMAAALLGWPRLLAFATFATLVIEVLFPLLVFSPLANRWCRAVELVAGVLLHATIPLVMRVGAFSIVMVTSYLLFARREWLDALRIPPAAGADGARAPRVLSGLLVVLFLLGAATVPRLLLPAPLTRAATAIGLHQEWRMFAQPVAYQSRWLASGLTTDGYLIEVLPVAAPELVRDVGWHASRWSKVRYLLPSSPMSLPAFGAYLCRRYRAEREAPELVRIDLFLTMWPAAGLAGTESATTTHLLGQPCR